MFVAEASFVPHLSPIVLVPGFLISSLCNCPSHIIGGAAAALSMIPAPIVDLGQLVEYNPHLSSITYPSPKKLIVTLTDPTFCAAATNNFPTFLCSLRELKAL